eukprot:40978-Pleurochrysis_carterae.AAC.1
MYAAAEAGMKRGEWEAGRNGKRGEVDEGESDKWNSSGSGVKCGRDEGAEVSGTNEVEMKGRVRAS